MKQLTFAVLLLAGSLLSAQTKSKIMKLKYTLPAGWNVEEFGGKSPWEGPGNAMCHCSGIWFFRTHKDGKMNVVVYPSTQAGLDSTKRNAVGPLYFEDVAKYDNIRNNAVPMQRKKSNFVDSKSKAKSYEAFRYFVKMEDHFYIIFAWQENMQPLNSTNEKELTEMIRGIELD